MAISHFIITKLPEDVISKIGLTNVVLNQQYDIAMEPQLKFERIPDLDGYYVKSQVKLKAFDASLNKYGNEAIMTLVWKEYNLANVPQSMDATQLWTKGENDNMLNRLPINQATEFIEIVSLQGVNNLLIGTTPVLQGHRLSPQDLLKAIYTTFTEGGGFPYFTMQYQTGRGTTVEPAVYTLTVNVESIAELSKPEDFSTNGSIDTGSGAFETVSHTAKFEVAEGYQNGVANLEVDVQCPFLTTGNLDTQSEVIIAVNGLETRLTENAVVPISLPLDEKGKGYFTIRHQIIKDGAKTGTSTVTLLDINGDPLLVSGTANTASIVSNA